jgi:adenylate cyclase
MASPHISTSAPGHEPTGLSHAERNRIRGVPIRATKRKFVTVLFVDLTGSMSLSGSIELEQWWDLIRELIELMCEGVDRFGGWVGNFTGDGVNAIFEAAESPEEHVRRACESALWLQNAMDLPVAARRAVPDLLLRIGLNSGEVVTGRIGDRRSPCYTASGYAVALAKRMESLAPPGRIYMTDHTATLVGPNLVSRDMGRFDVRGAPLPVRVYELVGKARPR